MARIYLKIIVSSPHELPFVFLNIMESYNWVDKILVTEANYTHTGERREYIYADLLRKVPEKYLDKVKYIQMNIESKVMHSAVKSVDLHHNEQVIRSSFVKHHLIMPRDIVFSVDADEIIYSDSYPWLLARFSKFKLRESFVLNMNVFMFRVNYLWKDKDWYAVTASRALFYYLKWRPQWRYGGIKLDRKIGCHFSWCMTYEEMQRKILIYGHRAENEKFADVELLKDAVEAKKYLFDSEEDFSVEVIQGVDGQLYPTFFSQILPLISHLVAKD